MCAQFVVKVYIQENTGCIEIVQKKNNVLGNMFVPFQCEEWPKSFLCYKSGQCERNERGETKGAHSLKTGVNELARAL